MNTRGITGVLAVVLAAGALLAAGRILFPSAPFLLPVPGPSEPSSGLVVVPAAEEPEDDQREVPVEGEGVGEPVSPGGDAVPVALPDTVEPDKLPQVAVGAGGYVEDGRVAITLGSSARGGAVVSLERRLAPLSEGECGLFGAWTATSEGESLPPGACAVYRILVDGALYYTLPEVVRYDGTPPDLPAVDVSEDGAREFAAGSRLWVAAGAETLRPVEVAAQPSDPESGIASLAVAAGGAEVELTSAPWVAQVAPSVGTIEVTAANDAGDTAVTTVEVVADGEAPHGGSISYPSYAAPGESVEIAIDPGSDAGSGVDASSVVVERRLAVRSGAGCESWGSWAPAGGEDTAQEGTCAEYRLRVQDNVANEAVVRSDTVLEVPDETAPVTAVTAPAPGSELMGDVTVSAAAEDAASGIRSVTFQVAPAGSSSWADIGAADAAPYAVTWDTVQFEPGQYLLRAVAVDRTGNAAASEAVRVVVADDLNAPTTWIVKPAEGAAVSGVVAVSAQAEDHESGVESVTVQVRSSRGCWMHLGTFEGDAGSVAWDTTTLDAGRYVLRSLARDRRGNVGSSSSVEVVVEQAEEPEEPEGPEEPEEPEEPEPKPDASEDRDDEPAAEEEGEEDAGRDDEEPSKPTEEEPTDHEPDVQPDTEPEPEAETSADKKPQAAANDTAGEGAAEGATRAAEGAANAASP